MTEAGSVPGAACLVSTHRVHPQAGAAEVPFNHRYLAERAALVGGRVLDYGCGMGAAVAYGLSRGLDVWGADTFDGFYADWGQQLAAGVEGRVGRIEAEGAPFPDASFDCVICNQVLEHVPEPRPVLVDIHRLLRPGGVLLLTFPVRETWYEGHIGLYFAHRLGCCPSLRRAYIDVCHRLGLGLFRADLSREAWVTAAGRTLDTVCFYHRTRDVLAEIAGIFGAPPADLSVDYVRARLGGRAHLAPRLADPLLRFVCKRRAGLVLEARKRGQ